MKRVYLLLLALLVLLGVPFSAEASSFGDRVEGLTEVTGVRVSSSQDRTRIVVDAKAPVSYRTLVLKDPGRIVVDIENAWLSPKVTKELSVTSPFVSRARIAQFNRRRCVSSWRRRSARTTTRCSHSRAAPCRAAW